MPHTLFSLVTFFILQHETLLEERENASAIATTFNDKKDHLINQIGPNMGIRHSTKAQNDVMMFEIEKIDTRLRKKHSCTLN